VKFNQQEITEKVLSRKYLLKPRKEHKFGETITELPEYTRLINEAFELSFLK
jgi:hypothetical protein